MNLLIFSSHSIKYIWYLRQISKYPLCINGGAAAYDQWWRALHRNSLRLVVEFVVGNVVVADAGEVVTVVGVVVEGVCVVFVVVDVDGCRVVVLGDKVKAVAVTFTRGMDVGAAVCLEVAAGEREAVVAVILATVVAVTLAAVDGDDVVGALVDALVDATEVKWYL